MTPGPPPPSVLPSLLLLRLPLLLQVFGSQVIVILLRCFMVFKNQKGSTRNFVLCCCKCLHIIVFDLTLSWFLKYKISSIKFSIEIYEKID
jgi:hypothetical protein